jgi:hypothetical protein
MDNLKFVFVNVRGLNTKEKRLKLFNWLKYTKTDIAFLQETESLYNFSGMGKLYTASLIQHLVEEFQY